MLPYQKHSQTSKQAAQQNTTANTVRGLVLDIVKKSKSKGKISDEIAYELNRVPNMIASRLKELEDSGAIVKLEETRKTRSNRNANVYVCPEFVNAREIIEQSTEVCPACGR